MKITREVGEYVTRARLEDLPAEAIYAAKGGIIDCLGCMLAGSTEPLADILCEYAKANGGTPRATVVGRGFKTAATEAALLNGTMAHALDYDDITWAMKGHPSAVLLPTLLALGEEEGATGREVLLAYMVGFEVVCSVGAAMSDRYFDDLGWHPTGPLGALGASAAAARLLQLDSERTAMAISLAASQAAGLRQNFGTMTKPFHVGLACRSGVTAARLVEAGFTASWEGLEGRYGFLRAFSGGEGHDEAKVLEGLGKMSYLADRGIELKKYPCCGSAHLALDALFLLLRKESLDPSHVDTVEVMVDFDPPRSLIHSRPKTTLEGKFSMQYCIAAGILDNRVGPRSFTDELVMRPQAQELIPRVNMARNRGFEGRPSLEEGYNEVRIRLKDGRTLEQGLKRPTEGSLRGATMEDLRDKFRDCASQALGTGQIDQVLEALEALEGLDCVSRLADMVRA